MLKQKIRKIVPKPLINDYHKAWAMLSSARYKNPSRGMIVIGVTGTNGKTTTCHIISHILETAGHTVGMSSSIDFKVKEKVWINNLKQGMLGRWHLQKLLKQMKDQGCTHAVIETTSEGLAQNRGWRIDYDVAVFTNLTPEHIESHGSFEKYKQAKGILFKYVSEKPGSIMVVNCDDKHSEYFLSFKAEKIYTYGVNTKDHSVNHFQAEDIKVDVKGSRFFVHEVEFTLPLPGLFNVYNALAAIAVCAGIGLSLKTIRDSLITMPPVSGRMEQVKKGQAFGVIVDYAHDPTALLNVYKTVKNMMSEGARMINVLGAVGGGRDTAKRKPLGRLAADYGDYVVVTNEDPYDDSPMDIIRQVEEGVKDKKILNETYFVIEDRRAAIKKAFELAGHGDVVVISGKGAEETMAVKGGYILWSDKKIAEELLCEMKN